jgi:hypothetical protein
LVSNRLYGHSIRDTKYTVHVCTRPGTDQCQDFLVSGNETGVTDEAFSADGTLWHCSTDDCAPSQARLDNIEGDGSWMATTYGDYIQVTMSELTKLSPLPPPCRWQHATIQRETTAGEPLHMEITYR